jgi:hypothetical protein
MLLNWKRISKPSPAPEVKPAYYPAPPGLSDFWKRYTNRNSIRIAEKQVKSMEWMVFFSINPSPG